MVAALSESGANCGGYCFQPMMQPGEMTANGADGAFRVGCFGFSRSFQQYFGSLGIGEEIAVAMVKIEKNTD